MSEEELKVRFAVYTWMWRANKKYIDLETKKLPEEEREKMWHDLMKEAENMMQENGIKPKSHNSLLVREFLFVMKEWDKEIQNDNR